MSKRPDPVSTTMSARVLWAYRSVLLVLLTAGFSVPALAQQVDVSFEVEEGALEGDQMMAAGAPVRLADGLADQLSHRFPFLRWGLAAGSGENARLRIVLEREPIGELEVLWLRFYGEDGVQQLEELKALRCKEVMWVPKGKLPSGDIIEDSVASVLQSWLPRENVAASCRRNDVSERGSALHWALEEDVVWEVGLGVGTVSDGQLKISERTAQRFRSISFDKESFLGVRLLGNKPPAAAMAASAAGLFQATTSALHLGGCTFGPTGWRDVTTADLPNMQNSVPALTDGQTFELVVLHYARGKAGRGTTGFCINSASSP